MRNDFGSSLRAKIAAGLGTSLLVLLVGGASYFAMGRSTRAASLVAHTDSVLIARDLVLSALKDAETGARGYMLTNDTIFLDPYKQAAAEFTESLSKLRRLSSDNRIQQARLDTLESVGHDALFESSQLVHYRQIGDTLTGVSLLASRQSKTVMDHAQSILGDMEADERQLLAHRTQVQRESTIVAGTVIILGSAIAFLLSLLVNRGIRRDVIAQEDQKGLIERQARKLKEQAGELAKQLKESRALAGQLTATNDNLQAASIATGEARRRAEVALEHASEAEREQARLARQNAELLARKDAVLRSTLDAIIAMDADDKITEFNPAAEQTFGYKRDDVIGRPLEETIIPERYREAHRAGLRRFLETGEARVIGTRLELPAMRSDGSEFLAELSITNTEIEGLPAFTGVVRDITEWKKAQLERERLIKALARSNEELDQFAYVASHDLKAPLRGIANLSQWVEEDLGGSLAGEGKAHMELLRGRVNRMEALIDGILQYSRAGRMRTKPELVNIDVLVKDVIELISPPARVQINVKSGAPTITTERVPLQQVFINLIGNAIKHAGADNPRIDVTWLDKEAFLEFAVADNGHGIAPQYHDRIFAIFQTLEARDRVEGTGIGLSVVKKIVEAQGGRVWVESDVDKGATFRFLWRKEPKTGE
ncbi:MAG: CHASE3 domain-containing protein [Gemmatimonadaceae bacterium]